MLYCIVFLNQCFSDCITLKECLSRFCGFANLHGTRELSGIISSIFPIFPENSTVFLYSISFVTKLSASKYILFFEWLLSEYYIVELLLVVIYVSRGLLEIGHTMLEIFA